MSASANLARRAERRPDKAVAGAEASDERSRDLRPSPETRRVGDRHLHDARPEGGGLNHHLHRPPEGPISHPPPADQLAPDRPKRSEVPDLPAVTPAVE